MTQAKNRSWSLGATALFGLSLIVTGCASVPTESIPPGHRAMIEADDDYAQLITQVRSDLTRLGSRTAAVQPPATETGKHPATATATAHRESEFAARARAMFAPLNGKGLLIPVVGVYGSSLDNSWHAPRDGGERVHKGIDIFAPKGTPVVAVTSGIVSFIGDEPKGGHCVWLTADAGTSFYYAHLDRWASGLYEGMSVRSGDILGYVGNTGNAIHTPSHLHFGVNQNDEMVNPYPLLVRATPVADVHEARAAGARSSASAR